MRDDPEIADLFDLNYVLEEKPGLRAHDELSQKAMTAVAVIADARAHKFKADMERATAKGAAG